MRGADAIVRMLHDRIDDALLSAAGEQLRVVANVAVGYDNVDLEAARRHGVTITNTPGVLTDATADLAIALLLAITRRLGEGERRIRSGEPWAWSIDFMLGRGLRGQDARDRRLRRDRPAVGGARPRVRDGGRLHEAQRRARSRAASSWTSCSSARTSSRCTAR